MPEDDDKKAGLPASGQSSNTKQTSGLNTVDPASFSGNNVAGGAKKRRRRRPRKKKKPTDQQEVNLINSSLDPNKQEKSSSGETGKKHSGSRKRSRKKKKNIEEPIADEKVIAPEADFEIDEIPDNIPGDIPKTKGDFDAISDEDLAGFEGKEDDLLAEEEFSDEKSNEEDLSLDEFGSDESGDDEFSDKETEFEIPPVEPEEENLFGEESEEDEGFSEDGLADDEPNEKDTDDELFDEKLLGNEELSSEDEFADGDVTGEFNEEQNEPEIPADYGDVLASETELLGTEESVNKQEPYAEGVQKEADFKQVAADGDELFPKESKAGLSAEEPEEKLDDGLSAEEPEEKLDDGLPAEEHEEKLDDGLPAEEPAPPEKSEEPVVPDEQAGVQGGEDEMPVVTPMVSVNTSEDNGQPAGWDQLKDAIKQDHQQTERKLKEHHNISEEPEKAVVSDQINEEVDEKAAVGEVVNEGPVKEQTEKNLINKLEEIPEDDTEKREVMNIIKKYAIRGCVLIVILALIFVFRIPWMIGGWVSGLFPQGEERQAIETVTQKPDDSIKTTIVAGEGEGKALDEFGEGVQTALVTGTQVPRVKRVPDEIRTLFTTGLPEVKDANIDRIASYMFVLQDLQNSFSTDIHELLNNAGNRQEALDLHIRQLESILNEALDVFAEINVKKDDVKINFNEITTEKDKLEKDFFVSLEKLEGNKSNDLLILFIKYSQEQIDARAEYNALNKISQMFGTAIKNMEARIKDIKYNREALIKGVKVINIKGSDLELIIQEDQIN